MSLGPRTEMLRKVLNDFVLGYEVRIAVFDGLHDSSAKGWDCSSVVELILIMSGFSRRLILYYCLHHMKISCS